MRESQPFIIFPFSTNIMWWKKFPSKLHWLSNNNSPFKNESKTQISAINASHLHQHARIIIFISSRESSENWLLNEFIQSHHRGSWLFGEDFKKTDTSSRVSTMPWTLIFDRKISQVSTGSLLHNEGSVGWCVDWQIANDTRISWLKHKAESYGEKEGKRNVAAVWNFFLNFCTIYEGIN